MKLLINIIFLSLTFSVFAQVNSSSEDAEKLLKDVAAKYKAYKTAEMNINLIIDLPEADDDQAIDVKAWMKGDKFKIELSDQVFISDNVTLWNYLKEYNEVQINNFEESDAIFSPSVIFNLYQEDYIYRIKESYKDKAGLTVNVIELSPIDKEQNFFKIDLAVDSKNTIVEAKIYERSGMKYIYKINSLKPNVELNDTFFKFDPSKYPNIEIIDARF